MLKNHNFDQDGEEEEKLTKEEEEERAKQFEEMRNQMDEDHSKSYVSNRQEKELPITKKFEIIKFGEDHPFYSHWIEQVSNLAPNGIIANQWLRNECSHVGLNVDDFINDGVDLNKEYIYTGHIKFEEKLKDYDIHISDKWIPYIAVRPIINKEKTDL